MCVCTSPVPHLDTIVPDCSITSAVWRLSNYTCRLPQRTTGTCECGLWYGVIVLLHLAVFCHCWPLLPSTGRMAFIPPAHATPSSWKLGLWFFRNPADKSKKRSENITMVEVIIAHLLPREGDLTEQEFVELDKKSFQLKHSKADPFIYFILVTPGFFLL